MSEAILQSPPPGVINAVGYATRVGGSCPVPAVLDAMQQAQKQYYEMDDLLKYASTVISRITGSEAGIVTCGAGAGLTLGAAAILARDDVEIMDALPDTSRLARRTFLYPKRNDFDYDHPVRASGARLEFFDFEGRDLEARLRQACAGGVAGVVYVWRHCADNGVVRRVAAICREVGTPLLLDGAMSLPPAENLREIAALGASLVTLSGGKHLGGPQNSGLLFGDASLIRSAWLQMADMDVRPGSWSLGHLLEEGVLPRPPRHGVGRGFKVGKDVILGCLAALELYPKRDFTAERARWHAVCQTIFASLATGTPFKIEYLPENGTGQYPAVRIEAPDLESMNRLKRGLKCQTPKIILAEDEEEMKVSYIYPLCLSDADVNVVIARMMPLLKHEE